MSWDGKWRLGEEPLSGPQVLVIKDKLWRKFSWVRAMFPQLKPEGRTDIYDQYTAAAVMQAQFNWGMAATGICDYAVRKALGMYDAVPAPPAPGVFYSFTGTWGSWFNGFGWDVGVRLDPKRWYHQPLGYNTGAFLQPDPMHSYLDMLNDGQFEFERWAFPDRRRKILSGYSGGAGCVVQCLRNWPVDRRSEIAAVIQFGDPNRPPGLTKLGNDPGGHGISEDFPPDWVLDRYYSFTLEGDMYPNAVGLLPLFYDILVRAEATPEFAMYLFGLFIDAVTGLFTPVGSTLLGLGGSSGDQFFGQLSGLLPMLTPGPLTQNPASAPQHVNLLAMVLNIPAIVQTIVAALQFVTTQAHSHYGDTPAFGGLSGVDRAVQIVNALP